MIYLFLLYTFTIIVFSNSKTWGWVWGLVGQRVYARYAKPVGVFACATHGLYFFDVDRRDGVFLWGIGGVVFVGVYHVADSANRLPDAGSGGKADLCGDCRSLFLSDDGECGHEHAPAPGHGFDIAFCQLWRQFALVGHGGDWGGAVGADEASEAGVWIEVISNQ